MKIFGYELTAELIECVLSFLDYKDLVCVEKIWGPHTVTDRLWKKLLQRKVNSDHRWNQVYTLMSSSTPDTCCQTNNSRKAKRIIKTLFYYMEKTKLNWEKMSICRREMPIGISGLRRNKEPIFPHDVSYAFSDYLLAVSCCNKITIFNRMCLTIEKELDVSENACHLLIRDGYLFASLLNGELYIWNFKTFELIHSFTGEHHNVLGICYSQNVLVTLHKNYPTISDYMLVYHFNDSMEITNVKEVICGSKNTYLASDGNHIISYNGGTIYHGEFSYNSKIDVWSVRQFEQKRSINLSIKASDDRLTYLNCHQGLIAASFRSHIKIFDLENGNTLCKIECPYTSFSCFTTEFLITAGSDGVMIWKISALMKKSKLRKNDYHSKLANMLLWSRSMLLLCDDYQIIYLNELKRCFEIVDFWT